MSNKVTKAEEAKIVEPVVENATPVEQETEVVSIMYPNGQEREFVGIISASRVLSAPTMDNGIQTRQALILVTVRRGKDKLKFTVGGDFLSAVEEFANDGYKGKAIELTYESCIKDVTGYEDKDGNRIAHTFTGNRAVNVEPMDDASYMEYLMMEREERNIAAVVSCTSNAAALAAYLTGNV